MKNFKKLLFVLVFVSLLSLFAACEPHEHVYSDWAITEAPTETLVGKAIQKCYCLREKEVELPVLTDTKVWTVLETKDATCLAPGKVVYESIYGKVTVEIEAIAHEYGAYTITVNPTLTEAGKAERVCKYGEKEEVTVPALTDEAWTKETVKEATCQEEGSEKYTSVYGQVLVTTPKASHEYGAYTLTVNPTLTEGGKAERVCKYGEKEEVTVAALTDEAWTKETVKAATCQEEGSDKYTSVYGEVLVTTSKLSHEYGAYTLTVNPTLTETGKATQTCTNCTDTKEVTVPALTDEAWTKETVKVATCQEDGSDKYTSVYGEVLVTTSKLSHEYGAYTLTVNPTLTETGKATQACANCTDIKEVTVPVLTDEAWTVSETKEANYNEKGYSKYTSVYGEVVVETAKLVAPYDNKTYHAFELDASEADDLNKFISAYSWSTAVIAFDETGKGTGSAFPFTGENTITMIDSTTGKVEIKVGEDTYTGYVDFATGIIVRTRSASFNNVIVYAPFDTTDFRDLVTAYSFVDGIIFEYTEGENTYSATIYGQKVVFGTSLKAVKDINTFVSESIALSEIKDAKVLYVESNNQVVYTFTNSENTFKASDKYTGKYTNGTDYIVLKGDKSLICEFETVASTGTYETVSENVLGIYVSGSYYEITLQDSTYTIVKPMVTITFDTDGKYDYPSKQVNKNIDLTFEELIHEQYKFVGWYFDEALTNAVPNNFKPTTDVTLYASWKALIIINVVSQTETQTLVLRLSEDDSLANALPQYTTDEAKNLVFVGWYLDSEFTQTLPEDIQLTVEDSGVTIYAKWESSSPYVGSFFGSEIYNAGLGGYGNKTLTIDVDGNISGNVVKSGKVVDYDKETQILSYTEGTSQTVYKAYYNEEVGVLVGFYSKNVIGNDFYIFSRELESTNGKFTSGTYYGLKTTQPGSSTVNYYAQFVEIPSIGGTNLVFLYNNYIYNNVIITKSTGEALKVSEIASSNTVVIKDAKTNQMLFGYAAVDKDGNASATFKAGTYTKPLDSYFGTYVNGDNTVVLDGTGNIKYNELSGTYTISTSTEYGFDVYLSDNTEYYQLTLSDASFTIVKPVVTITFNVGTHSAINALTVNKNVPTNLPFDEALEEGYVFNGFFLEETFTTIVENGYIPTEDVVLYCKYSLPAVLTINYNNGEAQESLTYSVGDIADIEVPVKAKHKFVGWYTTSTFEAGSEWTNGLAINEDEEIFAKWEEAPNYSNKYLPIEMEVYDENESRESKLYARTRAIPEIDPYGVSNIKAYPFGDGLIVETYNELDGTLVIKSGSYVYKGFLDEASGIIVITKGSSIDSNFDEVIFMTPFEYLGATINRISSSYWLNGKARAIDYTFEETLYRIFVYENTVYFGVSFTDELGNNIEGANCYKAENVIVKNSSGEIIAKYASDGTNLKKQDGNEGTYTFEGKNVVVNGVNKVTIDDEEGTYTTASAESTYTLDAYVSNVYYEITLNKTDYTCTVVKPMKTIVFETDSKAVVETISTNKNITIKLPEPTNEEYVFQGWYDGETLVDMNYKPVQNVVLTAKWAKKVTLTVVYGNTLENSQQVYPSGAKMVLTKPAPLNGLAFEGWYLDSEYTTSLTEETITNDLTVYVKWMSANPLIGSYKGSNIYGNDANGSVKFTPTVKSITVSADGVMSGEKKGEIAFTDDTKTVFTYSRDGKTYYGSCDIANGLILTPYGNTTTLSFGFDLYLFVKDCTSYKATSTEGCQWNGGTTKLYTIILTGHTQETMNVFIHENKVYGNVTFTGCDLAKDAHKSSITVYDCNGNVIYTK